MPLVTGIAVFFVLWWLLLFVILPLDIKGQHEDGDVVKGTEPGAPSQPFIKRKIIQTTILTAIVWVIIFVVIEFKLIDMDNIPFIPDFRRDYS
jgi:predicted secreted protein